MSALLMLFLLNLFPKLPATASGIPFEILVNEPTRQVMNAPNPWLPVREPKVGKNPVRDVVEFQRPWAFPDRNNFKDVNTAGNYIEIPPTIAGPYVTNTMPHHLFTSSRAASNVPRWRYQTARCPSETDNFNNSLARWEGSPLGDPVIFSAYLIGQIAHNPHFTSSFNLDADRGYGYLCWDYERTPKDQVPPGDMPRDDRQHEFLPPVPKSWPEGSVDKGN
jgi:hypothetical protein